jgi:hypothetical protein
LKIRKSGMTDHNQITELLEPLFYLFNRRLRPASEALLLKFHQRAVKRRLPGTVVEQLTDFYKVTNGVPKLDGFIFHDCADKQLFELWDEKGELCLGHRDHDVLRWKNDRFCLCDARGVNHCEEHEFSTLTELLEKSFEKWYSGIWEQFKNTYNEIDLWRAKRR